MGGESKVEIKLKRTKDKKKKGAAKVGTQNMRKKKRKKSRRSSLKVGLGRFFSARVQEMETAMV